jgi:hypothetical protein
MKYQCCRRLRRTPVLAHPTLNGIDFLEVVDRDLPGGHPFRQRLLFLHFLKPVAGLGEDNLRIGGGDRVRDVRIEWAAPALPVPAALTPAEAALVPGAAIAPRVLVLRTDSTGDHSTYLLRLVRSPLDERVPAGFDPQLAEVEFSFKVECPGDFDCAPDHACPPAAAPQPDISYLAKDYASFRRLLLDRIAQLVPGARELPAADQRVALTELLAYVGDHLSYRQDAAATEAYLGTARRRVSLRRHALLVDYAMHDGCNARAWVHVRTSAAAMTLVPGETQFLTRCRGLEPRIAPGSAAYDRALRQQPEVFEPLHEVTLRAAHNELPFHTWGDELCCLPAGATRATLAGHFAALAPGDYLLLEELVGPTTGAPGDASPAHRHVVRLTAVRHTEVDPIGGPQPLTDPLDGTPITEIEWDEADGLPFALCVTSSTAAGVALANVSVARGNLVLVDHGRTLPPEPLGTMPAPRLHVLPAPAGSHCDPVSAVPVPPRFRPVLAQRPLTQAGRVWHSTVVAGEPRRELVPFDPQAPAASALRFAMDDVRPQITLTATLGASLSTWLPRRNLLGSGPDADEFVVEIEADSRAQLRFGDDRHGHRPEQGTAFTAHYRTGNGVAGNVGAEAIHHIVTPEAAIDAVRNPLPAAGGVEPESAESVRRRAPEAFRRLERAVTAEDYAEVAERHAGVDHAAATLRWTGSWHTVFVTADRHGGEPVTSGFAASLAAHLERYRMAGHDLEFRSPVFVPLEIALHVCVKPDHFRADVRRRLHELISARVLRDGRRGLFHPDHFTFAQPVYLSRIYAAAHEVAGVASVQVQKFGRQGADDALALQEGRITLGRLEIARLDNDPDFPERGVLHLELHGGK